MKIAHSGLVDPTRPAGIEVQVATDPEGRPVAVALVVSHPSGATRIDASLAEWSELGVNLIARAPLDAAERHALAVRLLRVVLERELVRAGRVVLERERELAPTAVGAPWRAPEARKGDLATWWRVGPTPPFQTRALRDVVVARLHDRDRRGVWPRHPAARRVEAERRARPGPPPQDSPASNPHPLTQSR